MKTTSCKSWTKVAKLAIQPFNKTKKSKPIHLQVCSMTIFVHLVKIEGTRNKNKGAQENPKGNLWVLNFEWDHTYQNPQPFFISNPPPKLPKHSCRLLVELCQGPERVENVCPNIWKDNANNGPTKYRSFCVTPYHTKLEAHYTALDICSKDGDMCSPFLCSFTNCEKETVL